jgi:GH25 family lysozyme M1 (1,4-beta-N-acetylmuramidase)
MSIAFYKNPKIMIPLAVVILGISVYLLFFNKDTSVLSKGKASSSVDCKIASGKPGICMDKSSCTNTSYSGYCSGASNIQCCAPEYVNGIDVSHWNGTVDWNAVKKAGYTFAWIKATQGDYYTDTKFSINKQNAKAAGVTVGYYHFADLTKTAAANAAYFLKVCGTPQPGELMYALDVEEGGYTSSMTSTQINKWIVDFGKAIGFKMVFYTGSSTISYNMGTTGGTTEMLTYFPYLWLARYTSANDPGFTGIWGKWTVWQYSYTGKIGTFDLNSCEKTNFNNLVIPTPTTTTSTTTTKTPSTTTTKTPSTSTTKTTSTTTTKKPTTTPTSSTSCNIL